jgi:Fe-S-cluster-containing hydrogenase component 2
MTDEHRRTGVLTDEQLHQVTPEKRKVALIECVEDIPCDPCVTACPAGALTMDSLIDKPELIPEKCSGCGLCIAECPGLAIFVVDLDYSDTEAVVMLPYEFIPLPEKDEKVDLLDRKGKKCGEGRILKVKVHKNKTAVISVVVPTELAMQVRHVRRIV